MIAGGDCIDDADLLRCGATSQVLGHQAMAPSTLGTFLRSFSFGHVRQLDRLSRLAVGGVVWAGAGAAALRRLRHLTNAAAQRTTPGPSRVSVSVPRVG
jgi:hypothetical protein